ncbi:GNAT family N-acetyltransferase [Methylobacterium sp. Leaf87]|uniref:GNAT family N-acetyltransferase n=1 Tax=Methylobacterium sp. Leaf87 TaxID=1736243 RepID=UPI0009EB72E7|nr:GNAT family N-acetyltransferase [Methylobacterium sp. Leaf87]
MPVGFRPACINDVPAIVSMLADDLLGARREDTSLPISSRYLNAFAAIKADSNQLLLVADRANVAIACLQITFIPTLSHQGMWRGQISGVRVAQLERGNWIGSQMIRFAIDECRRRGCGIVQLATSKSRVDAHRFYEKLGFTASHEGMKLALTSAA